MQEETPKLSDMQDTIENTQPQQDFQVQQMSVEELRKAQDLLQRTISALKEKLDEVERALGRQGSSLGGDDFQEEEKDTKEEAKEKEPITFSLEHLREKETYTNLTSEEVQTEAETTEKETDTLVQKVLFQKQEPKPAPFRTGGPVSPKVVSAQSASSGQLEASPASELEQMEEAPIPVSLVKQPNRERRLSKTGKTLSA